MQKAWIGAPYQKWPKNMPGVCPARGHSPCVKNSYGAWGSQVIVRQIGHCTITCVSVSVRRCPALQKDQEGTPNKSHPHLMAAGSEQVARGKSCIGTRGHRCDTSNRKNGLQPNAKKIQTKPEGLLGDGKGGGVAGWQQLILGGRK